MRDTLRHRERLPDQALLVASFLIVVSLSGLVSIPREARAYTPHDPIYIDGNSGFNAGNGVVSGSGTPLDPYIIEGWEIEGFGTGMDIRNTNAHFIIRGVYIHYVGGWGGTGIALRSLVNGRVENSTISDMINYGILIESSTDVLVSENELYNNGWTIRMEYSADITVSRNEISDDTANGVLALYSSNIVVNENNISRSPSIAIQFHRSNYSEVIENILKDNSHGILVTFANNTTVARNHISNTSWGIQVDYSWFTNLSDNDINSSDDVGISFTQSSSSTVGNNTVTSGGTGMTFFHSKHAVASENNISLNAGSGIVFSYSKDGSLLGNRILDNARGIRLLNAERALIASNTFSGNGVTVDGEVMSHFNSHTITQDNLVNGEPIQYYKNCTDLNVDGAPLGQLIVANCTRVSATRLQTDNTDSGIQMGFVQDVLVADNALSSSKVDGVFLHAASNATVVGNTIMDSVEDGVLLKHSDDVRISDNEISNGFYGIQDRHSSNLTISKNRVLSSGWEGIYLYRTTDSDVSMNEVASSIRWGIHPLYGENIQIVDNFIISCDEAGIYLDTSVAIDVHRNTISSNTIGVSLGVGWWDYSFGVTVYGNDFIGNVQHATDVLTDQNLWNESYPIGGNYWDNYTGVDQFSGPDQDQPGSDGIGDSPYALDMNTFDYYPLMGPNGDTIPPSISISNPSDGQVLETSPIVVSGTASDMGGSGLNRVEVGVGGGLWLTANGTSPWSASVNLSLGMNIIEAKAWDGKGNSGTDSVTVTYSPLGDIFGSIEDSTGAGVIAGALVLLLDDQGNPSDTQTSNPFGEFTFADVPVGTYSLFVTATGYEGLIVPDIEVVGDTVNLGTLLLVPINNPPQAYFTASPATGNVTTVFEVNASQSFDLEDPPHDIQMRWDWEDDGIWDTAWSTQRTAQHQYAEPGNYMIRLEVRDTGGLVDNTTTLVVVETRPNEPSICVITTQTATVSDVHVITGTANDPDGTVEMVELMIDDGVWIEVDGTANWTYEWDTTSVANGDRKIYARAYDGTNYSDVVSVVLVVDNPEDKESSTDTSMSLVLIAILLAVIVLLLLLRVMKGREEERNDGATSEREA